jgi:hypothetical protein
VLGIDRHSLRAHKVLESVEAEQMQGAVAEEIEEISSGMIEMDTPSPEPALEDFAGEGTDGDGYVPLVEAIAEDSGPHLPPPAVVAYGIEPEGSMEKHRQLR